MPRPPSSPAARLGVLALVALALLGASCSFSVGSSDGEYDAGAVEDALRSTQEGKVGDLELGDATCPDDLELEEGMELTCTLAVGDVEAPYDVTITEVDADEPKIHVELGQAILTTAGAVDFVTSNLNEESADADVDCGDTQAILADPGDTIDCTVTLGGESATVQIQVNDTEGNVTFVQP